MAKLFGILIIAATAAIWPGPAETADEEVRLPSMGSAGTAALTPAEERRIAERILHQIRQSTGVLEDPLVDEYISDLGHRLAPHAQHGGREFRFFLVSDASINAFALPGGFVGIHSGLILQTNNEAELAGVVAHEIAHISQRHIARRVEAAQGMALKDLAGLLGAILVGATTNDADATNAAIAAAQASSMQRRLDYTRGNEYEADRVGIGILAGAGYDPEGMVSFFEQLNRRSRYRSLVAPEFLSTHPLSSNRVTEARVRAKDYKGPFRADSRQYHLMRARLQVLTGDDYAESLRFFDGRLDNAGIGEEQRLAARYGKTLARLQLDRTEGTVQQAQALLDEYPDIVAFHLLVAEARFLSGNNEKAREVLDKALSLFPGNLPLQLGATKLFLDMNEPVRARTVARGISDDSLFAHRKYRMLAEAASRMNQLGETRFLTAEYFMQTGQILSAIEQMQLALKIDDLSESQRSRYRARLEELQRQWQDLTRRQREQARSRRNG